MTNAVYVLMGRPGSFKDLVDLLQLISHRTSYQAGCEASQVWNNRNTSEIMLIEEWRSIEDLLIHIGSWLFKKMLAAMEMSAEEPKVSYYQCEGIRGMDLIEEIIINGNIIRKSD